MDITLNVSDELAFRIRPEEQHLPEILDFGLRELTARREGSYAGLAAFLEKLASLPTPEEVLAIRFTPELQDRIDELLEKNCAGGLSDEEQREWQQICYVEHIVRMAKLNAAIKRRGA